jgi:signal transduction histidine kinase
MSRVTILNVDDYEPARYARSHLLRSFGFDVREAKSGNEALSLVAAEPPHLVILDVHLPDMSGLEVCRRLKAGAATAGLPVLQMSATFTGSLDQAQGLESGADAYLTEPVDPPVLLATLNALLRMKRAEEAERATARQWQATFDAISDGVALVDAGGTILRANATLRALLAGDGDPVGRPLLALLMAVDGRASALPLPPAAGSGPRETVELAAAGRWLRVTVDPVEREGARLGAVCTVCDVTERKQVEEERARLLALEQTARTAAEAADRSKEEFIAMLAHELRNPLAPIRMALRTVRGPAATDPAVRRATEIVERQTRHLARLLDDLVDVARLTRHKIELRPVPTTLQAAVADAVEATRELVEARGHALRVTLPERALGLEADPTRLAQVIGNLVSNAARYTPPGGRITLRGAREGGMVVLRVSDTGIGITPEMLSRIFEPFTQGDRSPGRAEGGLGVGLSLARMLVELHGGTLSAASDGVGHGSEFVVRLPARPAPECGAVEAGPAAGPPRRQRVVVIEDDADTREVLRLSLELDGHEVADAADGPAGVELALRSAPDVVLVDIGLPGIDGYVVAERLRTALGGKVLLVALTGYGRDDDRRRTRAAGFDAHLVKPIEYERLRQLLAGPARPDA